MVEKAKKTILITGSSGMFGDALVSRFSSKYHLIGIDLQPAGQKEINFIPCNISETEKLKEVFLSVKPWLVIHAAAYTDVDGCEKDSPRANLINGEGTKNIAIFCREINSKLIYLGTDYVFDGTKKKAYREEDSPNPLNEYGRSKLKGEDFVRNLAREFLIVRTSWLFGPRGKNFVDTIIEKAKKEKRLQVVNDQKGSPTYTVDLAEAIDKLIDAVFVPELNLKNLGTYHISNSQGCSWFEFAKKILEFKKINTEVVPVDSSFINRPAKRPANSILDNSRYQGITAHALSDWQDALKRYLALN